MFQAVLIIVISQALWGALFFVLENVTGMERGGVTSFLRSVLRKLRSKLPRWSIAVWHLESIKFGLPQPRHRLYIASVNLDLGLRMPLPPPEFPTRPCLENCLHAGIPRTMECFKKNFLERYLEILGPSCPPGEGFLACLEVERNPGANMGPWFRVDGCAPCLRSVNDVWMVHVGDVVGEPLSRRLHPLGRFALQGVPAKIGTGLSVASVMRCSANAFSVPVVGAVLAKLIGAAVAAGRLWHTWGLESRNSTKQ